MSGRRQSTLPKPPPGPWASYANCLGLPADLFFPERGSSGHNVEEAKAVCRRCSVVLECRAYAYTVPVEVTGVWGGEAARERLRNRRHQRRVS